MLPEEFPDLNDTIYPSVGKRFLALLVDGLIFIPMMILFMYINNLGRLNAIYTSIFHGLIGISYHMFFLTRFGATPGKMLLKIKIVTINGQKIGLKEALLRFIVNLIIMVISIIITTYMHLLITEQQFNAMDNRKRIKWFSDNRPVLHKVFIWATRAWMWSDLIVLLCNKRKRALHDYIAGTVVIKSKYEEYAKQYSQKIAEFYGPATTNPNVNLTGENK